jgi:hypothetical protein
VSTKGVVAAAFTFGANLLHLVHTPRLYGQTWDAAVDWVARGRHTGNSPGTLGRPAL